MNDPYNLINTYRFYLLLRNESTPNPTTENEAASTGTNEEDNNGMLSIHQPSTSIASKSISNYILFQTRVTDDDKTLCSTCGKSYTNYKLHCRIRIDENCCCICRKKIGDVKLRNEHRKKFKENSICCICEKKIDEPKFFKHTIYCFNKHK